MSKYERKDTLMIGGGGDTNLCQREHLAKCSPMEMLFCRLQFAAKSFVNGVKYIPFLQAR